MKIVNLKIENFRRFESLKIDFHKSLTVIIAKNGQGKSTLLDAATVALGTFIGSFDMGVGKGITVKDARYQRKVRRSENEQVFPVVVEGEFESPSVNVKRELTGKKNKTTIKEATEITDYGKSLMKKVSELIDADLPVIAYYGSGRLWNAHSSSARKSVLSESRTLGYEDCLSPASNYKQLQQWMSKATIAALQQKELSEYDGYNLAEQIDGIKNAVDKVLEQQDWSNFHYSIVHEELAMSHKDHGILPVSILSDGVRAMISLVGDLAWRCAKLNPHLGCHASQKTKGIVFIDEVDMHLHPEWQQLVLIALQDTFEMVQFIVTTHSPQVLSTVPKECIRVLCTNSQGDDSAVEPLAYSYGEPSNDVLQAIMHVDPQPPVPEKTLLEELTSLVDQGGYQTDRADKLLTELKQKLNAQHPQIQKIERSIRRQEALKG
jgi:predicted ATP-binding protein involved in virulence